MKTIRTTDTWRAAKAGGRTAADWLELERPSHPFAGRGGGLVFAGRPQAGVVPDRLLVEVDDARAAMEEAIAGRAVRLPPVAGFRVRYSAGLEVEFASTPERDGSET